MAILNEKKREKVNKRYYKLYNNYEYHKAIFEGEGDVMWPPVIGCLTGAGLAGIDFFLINTSNSPTELAYGAIIGSSAGLLYLLKRYLSKLYDRNELQKIIDKTGGYGLNLSDFERYDENRNYSFDLESYLKAYYEVVEKKLEESSISKGRVKSR